VVAGGVFKGPSDSAQPLAGADPDRGRKWELDLTLLTGSQSGPSRSAVCDACTDLPR